MASPPTQNRGGSYFFFFFAAFFVAKTLTSLLNIQEPLQGRRFSRMAQHIFNGLEGVGANFAKALITL